MNLEYAVDRLYEVGWNPSHQHNQERLHDGRSYPSIDAVEQEFSAAGLSLKITQVPEFRCCRATWAPVGEQLDLSRTRDARHGAVIGACEREAAVYALAQLRESDARMLQDA